VRKKLPIIKNNAYIHRDQIFIFGKDAILTRFSEVVVNASEQTVPDNRIKRRSLVYKHIFSKKMQPIGSLEDILIKDSGQVTGFIISEVLISDQIPKNKIIRRDSVEIIGSQENKIVIISKQPKSQEILPEKEPMVVDG
jgi:uncharacterized protein YrrD